MGVADEKLQEIRNRRKEESSITVEDFSKRYYLIGIGLFFLFSNTLFWLFAYGSMQILKINFGRPEELEQVMYGFLSFYIGLIGYFFGQVVSFIILRHLGKRWSGKLYFGKHPVLFISLASWISFNICFVLLLSVIYSFK